MLKLSYGFPRPCYRCGKRIPERTKFQKLCLKCNKSGLHLQKRAKMYQRIREKLVSPNKISVIGRTRVISNSL